MTAETAPGRVQQARRDGFGERMIRRWVLFAVAMRILRDRRFQEKVITGAIAAVAVAQLGRDNKARPVRRVIARYSSYGANRGAAPPTAGAGAGPALGPGRPGGRARHQ